LTPGVKNGQLEILNKVQIRLKKSELRRILKEERELSKLSGNRLTVGRFASALIERGYVFEESEIPGDTSELHASLDAQVDNFLGKYEKNAKEVHERRTTFGWLMTEAPDDGEEADLSGDADEGEGEETPDAPPADEPVQKLTSQDINIEMFANNVARLIENYDSLLEVRSTLVRRAINFIADNYDEETILQFKNALSDEHGIEVGKTHRESELDATQPPRAEFAGPGGV
jgi:hypothetical protein